MEYQEYLNNKVIPWLEKQGEQEILCDKCRKEHPSHSCQDITELGRCAVEYEQKSADKVKPKFHKGEWIVHHGTENIYQVVAIIDNQYQLKYGDNYTLQNCVDVDRCARLWNITKDAKDGDVLAAHECYVIFKEIDGLNIKCYCTYHYIGLNPSFYVDTLQNKDAFYPATKEQCDQLKKAMTDAGYTFDFEKKELKKSEQNPAPMSLDEAIKHCEEKSCGNNACTLEHKQLEKWLTELKELKEQKSAWSEEDEGYFNSIAHALSVLLVDPSFDEINLEHTAWFQSLKERVQPKQEWSEEDESMFECIKWSLVDLEVKEQSMGKFGQEIAWLKSLKDRIQLFDIEYGLGIDH